MYPHHICHHHMQDSEDSWGLLAGALQFCDGLTEQLDNQFFEKDANIVELQEEIKYILMTASAFTPPTTSDILGLIQAS